MVPVIKITPIIPHYRKRLNKAETKEEKALVCKEICIQRILNPILREWSKNETTGHRD